MKKLSYKTGRRLGLIGLLMLLGLFCFFCSFLNGAAWWLDIHIFSPLASLLHLPRSFAAWFLGCYFVVALLLGVLAVWFSEDALPKQ